MDGAQAAGSATVQMPAVAVSSVTKLKTMSVYEKSVETDGMSWNPRQSMKVTEIAADWDRVKVS